MFSLPSSCLRLMVFVLATRAANHSSFANEKEALHTWTTSTPLAYVLIDNEYSREAVEAVRNDVVRRHFRSLERVQVLNVRQTDDVCRLVGQHPVVHMTRSCLPSCALRYRVPVVSIPSTHDVDFHCASSHASFAYDADNLDAVVVVAVASRMNWTSAVYVGDRDGDTGLIDRLQNLNSPFYISEIVSVKYDVSVVDIYGKTVEAVADFVLVHCHTYMCYRIVKKLFHVRNRKGLSRPWILTGDLTDHTRAAASSGLLQVDSVTYGLQKALSKTHRTDQLLLAVPSLQTEDPSLSTLRQQLQVIDLYDSLLTLSHILKDEWTWSRATNTSSFLASMANELNLHGIGGPIRFDTNGDRIHPMLYNVVDINLFHVATIGVYDVITGWVREISPLESSNRLNRYRRFLQKCSPAEGSFRVTTMIEPPFVIYDPNNTLSMEAHNGPFAGIVVDLMDWLAEEIGFTYNMSLPPDLKYGLVNKFGEGNGMIGQLMNCEVDLIAAAIVITESRSQYVHFTEPYADVGKSLLAYRKELDSGSLWSFLEPFDVTTRIVIVAVILAVCFIYSLSKRISRYSRPRESDWEDSCRRSTVAEVGDSFWMFYTAAMQQGPESVPSLSSKLLVAGWFFFCLVIVATYTANLTAFLTAKSFPTAINSLDDLVQQTEVMYGTVNDSSVVDFLKNSRLSIHRRMYDYMTSVDGALVDTAEEAIRRVEDQTKGDFIFIWDEPILDYVASHAPCYSHVIGRSFNMHAYSLAMPKGMPYADDFSLAILKLRESGIYDRFSGKWLQAGVCAAWSTSSKQTDVEEIRISDLQGVFVILAVAIGISCVFSIVERIWWRLRHKVSTSDLEGREIALDLNIFTRVRSSREMLQDEDKRPNSNCRVLTAGTCHD